MSQIKHIRDIKENEKSKISLVFYEGCQGPCIFKICKNRNLSEVYQVLMEVRHPNLAVVYDCVYEEGNTYVVEEYIPGKTLAELLEEKGTFWEQETAQIITAICEGLEVLHRQDSPIIHNDIKASNIMIREDGVPKLFDFDISRTYKEGSYKNTKLMGTHEYAAPEHYGFGQSDPRTDIYSLGCTMHEMLTGVGLNYEHSVTYQGGMAKIIQKCVEIDPKQRYASAALLKSDLEKYKNPKRHIWIIIIACICGVLLLTVGGMFLNNYLKSIKDTQDVAGTEDDYWEGVFETESEENTEGDFSTEKTESGEVIENTEDDCGVGSNTEGVQEETAGEGIGSEDKTEDDAGNSNTGNEINSETESEEISIPKKQMKTVYNVRDTLLAMAAWEDGTFLLLEEISGNYYLRSSDGKENLLEDAKAALGAQMAYNPYEDQMYLILFDYEEHFIYSVTRELEIELIKKNEVSRKNGAFLAFFSDGTLVYDFVRLDSNDWSEIESVSGCPSPYMISDKLYSLQFITNDSNLLYRFLEMDAEGKVVKEFPLEDEGISFTSSIKKRQLYNNSKEVYFIGNKDGKAYVFCFNGENYKPIACLSDYEGYTGSYDYVCVTDSALRYYSKTHKAIVEFTFE